MLLHEATQSDSSSPWSPGALTKQRLCCLATLLSCPSAELPPCPFLPCSLLAKEAERQCCGTHAAMGLVPLAQCPHDAWSPALLCCLRLCVQLPCAWWAGALSTRRPEPRIRAAPRGHMRAASTGAGTCQWHLGPASCPCCLPVAQEQEPAPSAGSQQSEQAARSCQPKQSEEQQQRQAGTISPLL